MSVPIIAFMNNKGGVGKTSLVYHIACMCSELGVPTIASDVDPQANLSSMFIDEETLDFFWQNDQSSSTIYKALLPLINGTGDIKPPDLYEVDDNLALLRGDLALSGFEEDLSMYWPLAMDGKERAFRVISAFWRLMQKAAELRGAKVILMDLGPNLGAINRAAMISADYVVVPLAADLFSLQGLVNLGPTILHWRKEWTDSISRNPAPDLQLPTASMQPVGYVVQQNYIRLDRPFQAYERWIKRIPFTYHKYMLDEEREGLVIEDDPECLDLIKHYRSLMPMAQEARKPMFALKPADGAIGSHMTAVREVYMQFKKLTETILERTHVR